MDEDKLLAVPDRDDALARARGRTGHLWQNRFYSRALDDVHLWRTLVCVEQNPVRAKLVRAPWQYPWSSAAAHVAGNDPLGLLDLSGWSKSWPADAWKSALRQPEDPAETAVLRTSTLRGRPLATDAFLSKLEHRLGRRLRSRPVGRPRKPAASARPKQTKTRKKANNR